MKIRIDKAACVGNARCSAISEVLFPLDEDGYVSVADVEVSVEMESLAKSAVRACPERVISIITLDES